MFLKDGSPFSSRLFTLAALALSVVALIVAEEILLPLALAIFLSFVLTPMTVRLERLRIGRVPSVLVVVFVTVCMLGSIGYVVTTQFFELSSNLSSYKSNLVAKIRDIKSSNGKFEEAAATIEEIGEELTKADEKAKKVKAKAVERVSEVAKTREPEPTLAVRVVAMPPSPLAQVRDWLGPLVAPLTTAGIVIVLVILILIQREDLRNRFLELCGTQHLRQTTEAIEDATTLISRYLRMSMLINTCYGICVAGGLLAIGVPNAILWGVLGMMLRFLPYIGPWMAAAMPIAVSLAIFKEWTPPLLVMGLFLTLEIIVNNILEPVLYGNRTGVSSLGVIVAAVFWTWIWGPVGLVVAMPLTVCLVVAGKHVPQLRFMHTLFGDRPALNWHQRYYQRLLASDAKEASKLAAAYAEETDLVKLYDDVVVPAMCLAEADRHSGMLTDQQEAFVSQATRGIVQEMEVVASKPAHVVRDPSTKVPRVLCIAVRDAADETAATMIAQLLSRRAVDATVGSASLLASEIAERIESDHYDIVLLSALPPLATRDGRYLCRYLRQRYPDIPIIVGIWNGGDLKRNMQQLVDEGATSVATNMVDALNQVAATPTSPTPIRSRTPAETTSSELPQPVI